MTYSSTTIVGNLGKEPEMKYWPNGNPFTTFSVATQYSYNDSNGNKVEEVTWWHVITSGKQAEACNKYLKKGDPVLVEGRLRTPKVYQAQDGTSRCNLELTANIVRFLSRKGDSDNDTEF